MSRLAPTGHGQRHEMPSTIQAFIDFLDQRFPEVLPRPGMTPEEVMFAAGQRSVALQMRAEFEATTKLPEG